MIISDFSLHESEGTVRTEAKISWEDSAHPDFLLFVQTEDQYGKMFWPDPNAFFVSVFLPAWSAGEKRIRVEGSLCPVLINNLNGVFLLLKKWYPDDFGNKPIIEITGESKAIKPYASGAISLLSGGIDSLSILRSNKLILPPGHPDAMKACVSVAHHKKPARNLRELREQAKGRLPALEAVTRDAGIDIIPVTTNAWWLNPDNNFFSFKSHGAQLVSITSFFSKGFNKGYIASSFDAAYLDKPWGSHPQLDAYYSTAHFQVQHIGTEMTRIEKVALVAGWPVALQNIRVCQNDSTGSWNCGTCEKCIRTMVMLEALGKLRECTSFPENDVSVGLLNYLEMYDMLFDAEQVYLYKMAIPLLKERKRDDLVHALEKIFQGFYKKQKEAQLLFTK
jgi:hypothetical protein